MDRCTGIAGWLFGHRYRARHNRPAEHQININEMSSGARIDVSGHAAFGEYVCDRCERCGRVAGRDNHRVD